MSHWAGPDGYSDQIPLIRSDSIDDILCWNPEATIVVQPSLQPVGYVNDKFPSKYYDRPKPELKYKVGEECGDSFVQPTSLQFSFENNADAVNRRITDIINQCRYLASKQGMDKQELIESIRKDEMEGRNYIKTINSNSICGLEYVDPKGMEWQMYPFWAGQSSEQDQISRLACNSNSNQYQSEQSPRQSQFVDSGSNFAHQSCSDAFVPRPPTRRTTAVRSYPQSIAQSDSDSSDSTSDECDSDVSEADFNKMHSKCGMDDTMSQVDEILFDDNYPPIRKSGRLDLASLVPKTPCNFQLQPNQKMYQSENKIEGSPELVTSSEDDENSIRDCEVVECVQDPRGFLLKKRFEASRKASVSSVFGELEQYDMMLSSSDEKRLEKKLENHASSPSFVP